MLRSMDLYFQRFGVPPAARMPRTYLDTVAMSMKSYEDVLWVEPKGWQPVVGWVPGKDQTVALHELLASRLLEDKTLARRVKDKALAIAQAGDLRFALTGMGNPCKVLGDELGTGRAQAASVPADGRYGFAPAGPSQASLGTPGETASGICGDAIAPVVAKALRTGDLSILEGADRTLKFMQQFKVPRASQVWEVPVHTPDILASGRLADAYLNAYRLSGKPEYLKSAVYWAKTGIPFIYMWRDPAQRPFMLDATIPVFGATHYTGSWFGVPVQWCGLAYTVTLQELAKYDNSMPWKHLAEMVTISGMNQQSTREKDFGTYTDNWSVITDTECVGCMLSPVGLLQNVYPLMGVQADVQTEIARLDDKPIAINSMARLSDITVTDGILQLKIQGPAGETGYTAVMSVAEPVQVEVDGAELPKRAGSAPGTGEGWSYREGIGCLTLGLKYTAEPRLVRIIKAKPIAATFAQPAWEFAREGDAEGWEATSGLAPLTVSGGTLRTRVTGDDPYMIGPGFAVPAAEYPALVLRARVTSRGGEVYFVTSEGGFGPERKVAFDIPADGAFHDIRVDMRSCPLWKGTIMRLRIDFGGAPNDVEVESVKLVRARG